MTSPRAGSRRESPYNPPDRAFRPRPRWPPACTGRSPRFDAQNVLRNHGVGMRPTIREVAREAGVSIATVSHALSGKRPVSGATRRRIKSAARRLGYRPNQVAASMITGRTQTLGVIVPDIANPFFSGLVHAAEVAAAGRGYTVVVA